MSSGNLVDYVPTIKLFLAHWNSVENTTQTALILTNGMTRDGLVDLLKRIEAATIAVLTSLNEQQTLQSTRERLRKPVHAMAKQARMSLKGLAGNTDAIGALPILPSITTAPEKYLPILQDLAETWARVNALPPATVPATTLPLTIPMDSDGAIVQRTHAEFVAAVQALAATVDAVASNAQTLKELRGQRDSLHATVRATLKLYAPTVKGKLPAGHALVLSLPKL
jgi:hypothetical protein